MLDFHQKEQKIPKQKQKEVLLSINTNSPFTKLVTSVHEPSWVSGFRGGQVCAGLANSNQIIPFVAKHLKMDTGEKSNQCNATIQVCAELANSNHCGKVCAGFDSKHIIYI